MNNENNPHVLRVELGAVTTDGAKIAAMTSVKKMKILSVRVMNMAAVAADNSNYLTVSLKAGSTLVASYDSRSAHEGALADGVSKAASIVSGQETQAAGVDLSVLYNETGTVAMTGAALLIEYFPY